MFISKKPKFPICICLLACCALLLASCAQVGNSNTSTESTVSHSQSSVIGDTSVYIPSEISNAEVSVDTSAIAEMDFSYTDRDNETSYKQAECTLVTLADGNSKATGNGCVVDGDIITVSAEGEYIISGNLSNGRIIVDADDSDKVRLILNGVDITCNDFAPVFIKSADKVFITLADNSENTLKDGSSYVTDSDTENVDGVIFSRADTTVNGSGKLTINANFSCGIVCKDELVFTSGLFDITSVGDGIQGKDCVKISGGNFTVNAKSDGIQANNSDNTQEWGFVCIDGGNIDITCTNDGIQAVSALIINAGNIKIVTDGGSANASTQSGWGQNRGGRFGDNRTVSTDTESAKGLKAGIMLTVNGGNIEIDSSDDTLHCNGDLAITNGTLILASGDDGIHADDDLTINGGAITISKSYEGIEATNITVAGGVLYVTASDDGYNSSGGSDGSAMGGRPGQNAFSSDNSTILICGGYAVVNASGDGIDSNGNITVTGGVTLVSGPKDNGNGALDYGNSAIVSGGVLAAAGSIGMAEGFSSSSTQCSVSYTFDSQKSGGTTFAVTDESGNVIIAFTPANTYQNVIFTSPKITTGTKINVISGGTASNADGNGYADSGSVSGGESLSLSVTSIITAHGSTGGGFGRR